MQRSSYQRLEPKPRSRARGGKETVTLGPDEAYVVMNKNHWEAIAVMYDYLSEECDSYTDEERKTCKEVAMTIRSQVGSRRAI